MGPQVITGHAAGMKGNSSQAVLFWNTVAHIIRLRSVEYTVVFRFFLFQEK